MLSDNYPIAGDSRVVNRVYLLSPPSVEYDGLGPTDALLGNLSAQQLFVLAVIAIKADQERTESTSMSFSTLSWAAAEEFDGDGTSIRRELHKMRLWHYTIYLCRNCGTLSSARDRFDRVSGR